MRQKRAGKIINISSMGGKIYTPLGAWYHATKHALEGWSDYSRFELKLFDIDVIIIEPSMIATEFNEVLMGPAMERSVERPYKQMAQAVASASENSNGRSYSPPAVIATTISGTIKANRPATRYAAGSMARPLLFVRKWFGDRAFDQLLARMTG